MKRRPFSSLYALVAGVTLLASLTACASPIAGIAPAALAEANLSPAQSQALEAALQDLVKGDNAFAFDLYQALRGQGGNLFFSPYSIYLALAMAYAGARTNTERQMAQIMHDTLSQDQLHSALSQLSGELRAAGDDGSFQLSIANSLWAQKGLDLQRAFVDTLARNYGGALRMVDFGDQSHREEARQQINDWVSQETSGKIQSLLDQGMLNDWTRLVLANAIYFKGEWASPFPANNTADAPFTLPDGTQVSVPTMSQRAQFPYAQGQGYVAIALPYKGGRISMIIILPTDGSFDAFEKGLNADQMQSIVTALQPRDIKLYMPKFQFASDVDLAKVLKAMGMTDAFDPGKADFSGIDGQPAGHGIYLSHAVHKAYVSVDEKGTEAAAATGMVGEILSMPTALHIDHPFIFTIYDNQTNSILFLGRVMDPR